MREPPRGRAEMRGPWQERGEDTRVAAQEITKLLTYVDFQRPVGVADVEAVSIVSAQGSVFELVDALGTGDGKKAQRVSRVLIMREFPRSAAGKTLKREMRAPFWEGRAQKI